MKIIIENEQDRRIIDDLCDLALKAGGIQNMSVVMEIQNSIEDILKDANDESGHD